MRKFGVSIYLLLVFASAWLIELGPVRRLGYAPGRTAVLLLLVVVMFTPALSSVIARLVERSGFGDAGLCWGRGRYHLVAWLLPFAVGAVALGLTVALGLGRFDLSMMSMLDKLPAAQRELARAQLARWGVWVPVLGVVSGLTWGVVITSIATFGEELGWRGYLQPRLAARLGPTRAMLAVGFIWGVWHAPIIVQGHNYPGHPVSGVFLMIAFCVVWSIILGGLFAASGSVLAPTIAHASINSPAASLSVFAAGVNPTLGTIVGVVGIAIAGCVAAWVWWRYLKRREATIG